MQSSKTATPTISLTKAREIRAPVGLSSNEFGYICAKGDRIFAQGDTTLRVYIIEAGEMREVTSTTIPPNGVIYPSETSLLYTYEAGFTVFDFDLKPKLKTETEAWSQGGFGSVPDSYSVVDGHWAHEVIPDGTADGTFTEHMYGTDQGQQLDVMSSDGPVDTEYPVYFDHGLVFCADTILDRGSNIYVCKLWNSVCDDDHIYTQWHNLEKGDWVLRKIKIDGGELIWQVPSHHVNMQDNLVSCGEYLFLINTIGNSCTIEVISKKTGDAVTIKMFHDVYAWFRVYGVGLGLWRQNGIIEYITA